MSQLRGARGLVLLWGLTGLLSLILNATTPSETTRGLQTAALLVAVFGTLAWLLRVLGINSARDAALIIAPALGAVLLGLFVLPSLLLPLLGAALGWLVVVALLLRRQVPAAQRAAVRHWRRGDYEAATRALDELIRAGGDDSHRLLRAQILLAWGKPGRAAREAQEVCDQQPKAAAAHNLLAEARMQSGDMTAARWAAERARELAADDWVAAYNLGMIADRQGDAHTAVDQLTRAQELRIPARRHRALTWLWLARAHCQLGEGEAAAECLRQLRAEKSAIREWARLLTEEAAVPLRALVAADITLAERLVAGGAGLEALGCGD